MTVMRKRSLPAILVLLLYSVIAGAANYGDIDSSNTVDLKDVILALQISVGNIPPNVYKDADVNGDGKIGLQEAIFVLQIITSNTEQTEDWVLGDLGKPDDYEETVLVQSGLWGYNELNKQLPSSFDWRQKNVVTPAKNQGQCGSCWAFAAVGAFESKILMSGGTLYDLSEQQQVSCNSSSHGCKGGYLTALRYWKNIGPMKENCTGYPSFDGREVSCSSMDSCAKLSYNTKDYFTIRDNKDEMKTSIFTDGPGVFRYDVYSDFMDTWNNYSPGKVYKNTGGQYKGGHAVLIIGWDDSKGAWLCKNSWGNTGPNRDGTFWIAYSGHVNNLNFGMANITITSGPVPSDVKSPVYQFVNTLTIDHFFTANEKEKTFITASSVWKYEGIVWYAFTSRQTDTLPVYRFANTITGEHFYTISEIEKNNFIIGGWRYEGIAWHAYGSQKTNTFPVYRLLNTITGEHFYTISETVKNNLVTTTYWKNEGVAWYTYKK